MTRDPLTPLAEAFAPFALRVTAGPLEMSVPDDPTLLALADLAAHGIHDADRMPFDVPWTQAPPEQFTRLFLQYHWGVRAEFGPDAWRLELAVRYDGELVGMQGLAAHDFLAVRSAETGSWLGRAHQGRGIGTMMRQAICALAFDHLGVEQITSGAFVDNEASNAVSRKVGYRPNGVVRKPRDGRWVANQRYLLTPDALVRGPAISVHGAAQVRHLIGLG